MFLREFVWKCLASDSSLTRLAQVQRILNEIADLRRFDSWALKIRGHNPHRRWIRGHRQMKSNRTALHGGSRNSLFT
jgi:hypothetical protein